MRWELAHGWPADSIPVLAVGPVAQLADFAGRYAPEIGRTGREAAEGYRIRIEKTGARCRWSSSSVTTAGVLFGVGRLLRELQSARGNVRLAEDLNVSTAPKFRLRGHQLGYRPKTNSYDGWDLAQWEHYIRDLALFGTNAIELIPPAPMTTPTARTFPCRRSR